MTKFVTRIRGHDHEWSATVNEASVADMRADGIEIFEVANIIPTWVDRIGMTKPWCWMQDIFDLPSRIWRKWRVKP